MSEPLSDQQRKTEQSSPTDLPSPGQDNPTQFSLRGLLWFMLVASAYFAQFAALREFGSDDRGRPSWRFVVTALVAWILLASSIAISACVGCGWPITPAPPL